MRVGIDFGTTHTVAAVVDRGNYPVVSFDGVDTWPSLVAANDVGELRFGYAEANAMRPAGIRIVAIVAFQLECAGMRSNAIDMNFAVLHLDGGRSEA